MPFEELSMNLMSVNQNAMYPDQKKKLHIA